MILLALVALATLAANGSRPLRQASLALAIASLAAGWLTLDLTTIPQLAVTLSAGLVAAIILYVAAPDGAYGEEPGWRLWLATIVAAAATPIAFATFRIIPTEAPNLPMWGPDPSGLTIQVAALWLLASGIAIMLSARSAVRMSLGAVLTVVGLQLLVRLVAGSSLTLTLLFAWLEVVVALAGAFLIINERAASEP